MIIRLFVESYASHSTVKSYVLINSFVWILFCSLWYFKLAIAEYFQGSTQHWVFWVWKNWKIHDIFSINFLLSIKWVRMPIQDWTKQNLFYWAKTCSFVDNKTFTTSIFLKLESGSFCRCKLCPRTFSCCCICTCGRRHLMAMFTVGLGGGQIELNFV